MVSRCMKGIGALLYRFEKCVRCFSMMGKRPVGVRWPARPVDTVVTPISVFAR